MIKIHRRKVGCPPSLDTRNKTLVENDYKRNDVHDALLKMQHFKCCYCEKDLSRSGKSEIWVEHFVAKTDDSFKDAGGNINWNEANAWENLLYACGTCNRSKGTIPPFDSNGKRNLINPSYSRINPEDHVEFFIEDVIIYYKERDGSSLGSNTIKNLKLKARHDVYSALRKREIEIDSIFSDLVDALSAGNDIVANSKLADLTKMTSAHQSHASFCRKYIIQQVNNFNGKGLQTLNQNLGTQIRPIKVQVASGYQVIA
jgi:uncharacterized protein (TIGR02646 family)